MPIVHKQKPYLIQQIKKTLNVDLEATLIECVSFFEQQKLELNRNFTFRINPKKEQDRYNHLEQEIIVNLDKQGQILKRISQFLGNSENAFEFITFHEIGHATQHSSLFHKDNPIQDSELEPFRFYNQHFDSGVLPNLNRIFSKTNIEKDINGKNIPEFENIHYFMRHNLSESYADLYASYALYLQDKNINIFDQIQQYRESDLVKLKTHNPNAVSRYENTSALDYFKQEVLNFPEGIKFEQVHQIIQKCLLKGLVDTMAQEYKSNPAFRNDFQEYTSEDVYGFFHKLANESKSYGVLTPTELNNLSTKLNSVNTAHNNKSLHLNNVNENASDNFCTINLQPITKYREPFGIKEKFLSM